MVHYSVPGTSHTLCGIPYHKLHPRDELVFVSQSHPTRHGLKPADVNCKACLDERRRIAA